MPIGLLDTNVWVSALLNPHGFPARFKDAWVVIPAGQLKLCRDPDDDLILERAFPS